MPRKASVTLVGPGRLGRSLALALHAAGYPIRQVVTRSGKASQERARRLARSVKAEAHTFQSATYGSDIVWLCVPDSVIASCAQQMAQLGRWKGRTVLHTSGALGSDELRALKRRGARVGSLHPMMTFTHDTKPSMRGLFFAFEGNRSVGALAKRVIRDLGGEFAVLKPSQKPLYHATGSFSSPLLVALLAAAERVAGGAAIPPKMARKLMQPIVMQTLKNYFKHGSRTAFGGPIARGDLVTVRKHLRELERVKGARNIYIALADFSADEFSVNGASGLKALLREGAAAKPKHRRRIR